MPRPKSNSVYKYYKIDNALKKLITCMICNKQFKGIHATNLVAHLKAMHREEYLDIEQLNKMKRKRKDSDSNSVENDGADDESSTSERNDVWCTFQKEAEGTVTCNICKTTLADTSHELMKHMKDKHNKLMEETKTDSDEEQNCYTEIVYIEEEGNTQNLKPDPSDITKDVKPKTRSFDEVENFGKYITSLLKQLPEELCSQLQMEIINLVMSAKLKKMKPAKSSKASYVKRPK